MSLVVTYHSLAIDCDSPPDLQRSPGVMVGRKVCVMEGGGHSPSGTGRQVGLVVSSLMVHIREFGPWAVSRGILEVTETSPFDLLTLLPSDLARAPIKPQAVSLWESCLSSFILWFSLHEWLCVSQWSVVYSAVTEWRVGVIVACNNVVIIVAVIFLFSSIFFFYFLF